MHVVYPAVLAVLLFSTGLYGVLARRNAILVLMSVELMLNAVNLNLVAFDAWLGDTLHAGQALTLFTITIAAAEIGLGLAIVLLVFRHRGSSDVDRLTLLAEPPPGGPAGEGGPDGPAGPDGWGSSDDPHTPGAAPAPAAGDEKADEKAGKKADQKAEATA